jgi:hypothetical protein
MHASQVLVEGVLRPDGTLELNERPKLPPGPVEVLIRNHLVPNGAADTWWEYLEACRADLLATGETFRTREDIDNDRADQARPTKAL